MRVISVDAKRLRNLALVPIVASLKSALSSTVSFTMLGAPWVFEASIAVWLFWLVCLHARRAMLVHSTQHLQSGVVTTAALLASCIALL